MTPNHSTSSCWLLILLASMLFACGGDDPPLLQNSGEDTDVPETDMPTGVTNNVVFPDDDMGMEDAGECQEGAEDEPDPLFFDANCDGIDGDESKSVFVASYGNDSNAGSKSLPKLTIAAALDAAKTEGKTWVLVEESLYEGGFELVDGVNIAGGYGFGWRRDGRAKTTIRGGAPAIRGLGITSRTVIMDLTIESGSVGPGETAVGVLLESSSGVVLEGLRINGGRGGDGAAGTSGINGGTGNTGGRGGNAPADSNSFGLCINKDASDAPAVGTAGAPACGSTEGAGGAGGKSARGTSSGLKGADAPNGGGEGGAGGARSTPGMTGRDGGSGTTGGPGIGGETTGSFEGASWIGSNGESGQLGSPGKGGGGGGGGGGGRETIGCDSWGGAGGGGGSGGCGGEGGLGGGFGGASVALMLLDSDVVIRNCQIYGGAGGNGGTGGQGGEGGQGGAGGLGGNKEENSGPGGAGGRGGTGGRGGEGGGGAGGPSIGLYSNRPLTTQPVNTNVMQGEGGRGGSAGGAMGRGADGLAEAIRILQ